VISARRCNPTTAAAEKKAQPDEQLGSHCGGGLLKKLLSSLIS
jgi:hypothetical protein